GKRIAMKSSVAHQDEARVIGNLGPFVKIESDRIRQFDAGEAWCDIFGKDPECAKGAIDVEPELFPLRNAVKAREIVNRPNVNGAGGSNDQERRKASVSVRRDRSFKRNDVDLVTTVRWNLTKCLDAEAGKVHRLGDAAMDCRRCIGGQTPLTI